MAAQASERSQLVDQNPRPPNLFYVPPAVQHIPTPVPQLSPRESWTPFFSQDRGCSGVHESGHCGCCSKRSLSTRINDSNLSDADKAFLGNLSHNVEQVWHSDGGECVLIPILTVVAYGSVSRGWEVLQSRTDDGLPVPRQPLSRCPGGNAVIERSPADASTSTGV
jgi:hypothetical protein